MKIVFYALWAVIIVFSVTVAQNNEKFDNYLFGFLIGSIAVTILRIARMF